MHDSLTNLPNRTLLQDRLDNALKRSVRSGACVGVLFIDLDGFKLINDNYGHEVGDKLLIAIGERIMKTVRPGDTVSRFGGDEFVVLCDQLQDERIIEEIATRISYGFKQSFIIEGIEVYATISIGIATGTGFEETADTLLSKSDAAMYRSKQQGRDGWMYYSDDIGMQTKLNLDIANGIRSAVIENSFSLVYQPILDIKQNKIVSVEALLRWSKDGEFVPPDVFIPIAEWNGTISQIGEWVFREACTTLARWNETFTHNEFPSMSINLSSRQLVDKSLFGTFREIIQKTGARADKIVLEITETALLTDMDTTLVTLEQFSEIGVRIAIDDFGTGYSSLSQMKHFPIDRLKIDKSFIENLHNDEDNYTITSAVIMMAHALGLELVAEGVETKTQLDILKKLQCDHAQGYYFYKPLADAELFTVLSNSKREAS